MDKATDSLDRDGATAPGAAHDSPVERIDLERAIRRLPPGCREAFVLHDVEGYEHREIAQMLGIAEGTSKSQVFKARLKLRSVLA
jgi:RNA polymerase sigma-70 factor (ECF subfamily)